MLKPIIITLLLMLFMLSSGCGSLHYEAIMPDSSKTVIDAYVLGNTTVLENGTLTFKTPNGSERSFTVNGLDNDQVQGMKAANELLKSAVEGVVQGAVQGVK